MHDLDYSVYKYFKGETVSPFTGDANMWWFYESHFEQVEYNRKPGESKKEIFEKWIDYMIEDQIPSKWGHSPEFLRDSYEKSINIG